jgi:hypothetical protein
VCAEDVRDGLVLKRLRKHTVLQVQWTGNLNALSIKISGIDKLKEIYDRQLNKLSSKYVPGSFLMLYTQCNIGNE